MNRVVAGIARVQEPYCAASRSLATSGDSGYGFRLKAKTQPGARRFDTVARSIFKFTKDKMAQIFVFAT